MKVSATDNNSSSLIVEDEERASSGVETIIATDTTEESSFFNATADADDHAANDRAAANDAQSSDFANAAGPKPKRKTTNKCYIVSGVLATAAVLGIVSYSGHSIHSSKQQVAALNNNNVVKKVKGFDYMDIGACKDGNGDGNEYDYIRFDDIKSPKDCGKRCTGCPGGEQAGLLLRGIVYWKDANECYCLVDDGASGDTLEGACAGAGDAYPGVSGIGEIQGTNGNPDLVCYKRKGGKSKSSKRGKSKSSKGENLNRKLVATENK